MERPRSRLPSVLIVDDESAVRDLLSEVLSENYQCTTASSAEEALKLIGDGEYSVVISDIDMPGISGIEMVPKILALSPDTVILMISGSLSIDYAVRAIRVGAYDYITKPFELDFVERSVRRAVEHHRALIEKKQYETDLEELVRQRTEELSFLIYHDSLTNLPNRVLFEDRLSRAVLEARSGGKLAVLFLSVDNFEKMQDHFGHCAADEMLKEVALRITATAGDSVLASRLQGCNFAMLVTEGVETERLLDLSDRLRAAIRKPLPCRDTEIFLTASIGICIFPDDGAAIDELMKNAGNAIWRAREGGGDATAFYADGINADIAQRIELEGEMRRGIDNGEFEVYYQPKVNIETGGVVGAEALIRWNHPEKGMVSPADFIPIAEETGLIVPLGEFVLESACSQVRAWHDKGNPIEIAVNVSARQLKQGDLADRFLTVIDRTGIDPEKLNLEVTESSLMESADRASVLLELFRRKGVRISLDDFGTGYSSLAYLKTLPIDQLKIDKVFIEDLAVDPNDTILVHAMVNLAHNLRLRVVAEGVETTEQLQILKGMGCDEYQGYLYSKPISAAELEQLMTAEKGRVKITRPAGPDLSISPQSGAVVLAT
ncbi:MAG: putative bifunctional diguanylate cyclase/phosphodiesterase [Pyrinomonadaceae bacterium]